MASKLFSSITTTDSYILWIGVITLIVLVFCLCRAKMIQTHIDQWKRKGNPVLTDFVHRDLAVAYNLFLTLISIFPLLGMFGTVMGLLNVDFAAADMDNVKVNFFSALTSTAWGIVFSIVFKIINALFANHIETQIENSKEVSEAAAPGGARKQG